MYSNELEVREESFYTNEEPWNGSVRIVLHKRLPEALFRWPFIPVAKFVCGVVSAKENSPKSCGLLQRLYKIYMHENYNL